MEAAKHLADLKADIKRLYESCSVGSYDEAACRAHEAAIAAYDDACVGGHEWFRKLMVEVDGRPCRTDVDRAIFDAMYSAIDNGCATMVERGRQEDIWGAATTYSKETVGHILRSLQCVLADSDVSNDVRSFYEKRGVRY